MDEVLGDNTGVTAVRLKSTQDESTQDIDVQGLFVAIGLKPNSAMFDGQLNLRDGYIKFKAVHLVMPQLLPSQVYSAAGDIADSVYRQSDHFSRFWLYGCARCRKVFGCFGRII